MRRKRIATVVLAALVVMAGFSVCEESGAASSKATLTFAQVRTVGGRGEKPVAPEKNPPGDIPDSQVFVKYTSAQGGYQLQVPEGWARTANGADVTFTSKLDGLSVTVMPAQGQPSADGIRANRAQALKNTGRAVTMRTIRDVTISGEAAVLMAYECNSEPNPVTNKQVRLENDTYFFYRSGKLAALRLWAPLGADNVDQWRLISRSFRWQ